MPLHSSGNRCIERVAVERSAADFSPRYLAAKKSIDDRSLNRDVWETLRKALPRPAKREPLVVLEVGAGIGAMLARLLERGLLTGPATYVASDRDPEQLRAARRYLSQWAQRQGHLLSWSGARQARLRTVLAQVSVVLLPACAEALAEGAGAFGPFHLLIAHAVLDLVDFPALLPGLLGRLAADGLAYLACNFDGETVFLPECAGEPRILAEYHASMEERLSGASRTGRRLLSFLQRPGLEMLAAGSADWVIHPRQGGYPAEEGFFLHRLIETIQRELAVKKAPPPGLDDWARLRHRQVEAGVLSLMVRNLDLLVRRQDLPP